MLQKRTIKILITAVLGLIPMSGCSDERATQFAREAADRQAQQNTAMAELNKELVSGTKRLVEADSQARQEVIGVHRELQAERTRLDTGWNSLEQERQQIAAERRTESMLVPVTTLVGGVLLVALVLGFCWYALFAVRRGDDTDAQLNELLVCEILPVESTPLLLGEHHPHSLMGQPAEQPTE